MITIKYYGRLGNNLDQYALGRILANRYKYQLNCKPVKGFVNTEEKVDGKIVDEPVITLRHNRVVLKKLDSIASSKNGVHIHLKGTFAYYPNFEPHKDEIKRWFYLPRIDLREFNGKFKTSDSYNDIQIDGIVENDVLLHIRLGDLLDLKGRTDYRAIFFDYYDIILSKIKFNRLFIISDSIKSEYVRAFNKYNPILLFEDSVIKTVQFFNLFSRIIMSRSSFAWWGAWLSNAKEIYFPIPENGLWGENNVEGDVNLLVNEPRFIYVRQKTKEFIPDYFQARNVFKLQSLYNI